jgi:hypothetical protein
LSICNSSLRVGRKKRVKKGSTLRLQQEDKKGRQHSDSHRYRKPYERTSGRGHGHTHGTSAKVVFFSGY